MAIRDLITSSNVLAYAKAGIDVARAVQRLRSDGYESMIVPSRGAVPVLNVAQAYYRRIVQPCMSRDDRIGVGLAPGFGPLTRSLDTPFTADAGRLRVPGLSTAQIRRFWARVVAAIVRRQADSPYYRLFRFVRDEVCHVGHHPSIEWRIEGERFLFIDTVVSGRAVTEIVDAFDAEGLTEIHYILLLDECGQAMRAPYDQRIRALAAEGRATLVEVPSLFTEDQGPAVSGLWSVVVPKFMEIARADPLFADGVIGAGLFYHEVQNRPDNSNLEVTQAIAQLWTLLFSAMHVAAEPDEVCEDLEQLKSGFADERALDQLLMLRDASSRTQDYMLELYLEHIEGRKLFGKQKTLDIASAKIIAGLRGRKGNIDVSSSHCLRLHVDESEAARLMARFKQSLAKPYWTDASHTERAR